MQDSRHEILNFWFEELDPQQWFQSGSEVDEDIRTRFSVIYGMAKDGLCNPWAVDADGAMALTLVLDQFPRHMFRGTAAAFATDEKALLIAKQAISKGFDQILDPVKRGFLYVPFQHSEELRDQERSVKLMEAMGDLNLAGCHYARRHKIVIEKFGRFPHRNAPLGRSNTGAEDAELMQ